MKMMLKETEKSNTLTLDLCDVFWYTIWCRRVFSAAPTALRTIKNRRLICMKSREVLISNASGLHARPATFFIQKANCYKSSIWVEKEDRKVNAKSLLGVLSLGIAKGMTVTLYADGQDEDAALNGLAELVGSGFSEN
jgi:phosphocarrier protein HPr